MTSQRRPHHTPGNHPAVDQRVGGRVKPAVAEAVTVTTQSRYGAAKANGFAPERRPVVSGRGFLQYCGRFRNG